MPKVDLKGKAIAITGASSGIGAATALACARAGMSVALFARREDKLRAVAARIDALVPTTGARALVVTGSADQTDDNARLLAEAKAAFGPLYAVFANAGYGQEIDALEMSDQELRQMFEVNFFGTFDLLRQALPAMRERGAGHAVMCSSCVSKISMPGYAAYCASKAAQDHFARAIRHEVRADGVAVSSVHPIWTKTEFFEQSEARSPGGLRAMDGVQRAMMQPPERVAGAVVRQLRKGKGGEIWTSRLMRTALGIATIFPGLTDAALGRMHAKQQRGK